MNAKPMIFKYHGLFYSMQFDAGLPAISTQNHKQVLKHENEIEVQL